MMNRHEFCLVLLAQARDEARNKAVLLPRRITALSDGNGQYFMEAEGMEGRWVSACCSYEARAKLIRLLIDACSELDQNTARSAGGNGRHADRVGRRETAWYAQHGQGLGDYAGGQCDSGTAESGAEIE